MVSAANDRIDLIYVGEMGVRQVYAGDDLVYERPGGYFYLYLETGDTYSAFIPKDSVGCMMASDGCAFKVKD